MDFSLNRLGAVFSFKDTEVKSRVGVSFISTDQACRSVNNEIPDGTSLSKLRDDTRKEWEDKVLSKVTTTETDPELLARLYSALYFMNLLPQNKTGENPLWESEEPYYDDIFTFWDTVSAFSALHSLVLVVESTNIVNSSDAPRLSSTSSCPRHTRNLSGPGSTSGDTRASCPTRDPPFGTVPYRVVQMSTTSSPMLT